MDRNSFARFFLLISLALACQLELYAQKPDAAADYEGYSILIDKGAFELRLLDAKGAEVLRYPVATGLNPGQKTRVGDCKTPQGTFVVTWVQDTRGVLYDYHDGAGPVEAYGPWFIHMEVPGFRSIGIHGTCPERDDRIGTRDTKACVRLHNDDIRNLVKYVYKGMKVTIVAGPEDDKVDKHRL